MEFRDYYKILGVGRDASQEDIQKAYRRLARKYHPDVSDSSDAEQRFKEVGEAYEVLKDPERREAYNQLGSNWQAGQSFRPPPKWSTQFHSDQKFSHENQFSDFFQSLFGDERFDPPPHFRQQRNQRAELQVTLEQLVSGQPIDLIISSGTTGDPPKRLNVKIPRGISAGESFRLKGQGRDNSDLYLTLRIRPHPRFHLEGKDTYSEVGIAPWEAVLGTEIRVATLHGDVNLTVPAGTTQGKRMRLRDKGLPGGHHYVTFRIEVPQHVSKDERKVYERLAQLSSFQPQR